MGDAWYDAIRYRVMHWSCMGDALVVYVMWMNEWMNEHVGGVEWPCAILLYYMLICICNMFVSFQVFYIYDK